MDLPGRHRDRYRGRKIKVGSVFDGWGYLHLFDSETLQELDTYAIPEAHDPAYAFGFGDLSVHEVAVDPQDESLAYLSYYSGGLRAIQIQCGGEPYDSDNPPADPRHMRARRSRQLPRPSRKRLLGSRNLRWRGRHVLHPRQRP